MTGGLWVLIAFGVVVACIVACDAIARKQARGPAPGALEDPRVAYMVTKQRAYGRRLRREGRSLMNKTKGYSGPMEPAHSLKPAAKVYAIKGGKR